MSEHKRKLLPKDGEMNMLVGQIGRFYPIDEEPPTCFQQLIKKVMVVKLMK